MRRVDAATLLMATLPALAGAQTPETIPILVRLHDIDIAVSEPHLC